MLITSTSPVNSGFIRFSVAEIRGIRDWFSEVLNAIEFSCGAQKCDSRGSQKTANNETG
jgi:hypothetical protein